MKTIEKIYSNVKDWAKDWVSETLFPYLKEDKEDEKKRTGFDCYDVASQDEMHIFLKEAREDGYSDEEIYIALSWAIFDHVKYLMEEHISKLPNLIHKDLEDIWKRLDKIEEKL
jgi:hypothetical protein